MEKIKTLFNNKTLTYITLLGGVLSMLFIGQEKQIGLFAWIAPVLLLHFTRASGLFRFVLFFVLMIICGYITQQTHNHYNDVGFGIFNGIAYAIVHSVIYLTDRLLYKKGRSFLYTLVFPLTYVVVEALVSTVLGTSGILAQTQFFFAPLAQLSTLTGMFGITFIVCWLASVIHWLFENGFSSLHIKKSLVFYGGLFLIIMLYGIIRMATKQPAQKTVKVATISGVTDLRALFEKEKEAVLQLSKNTSMPIPERFYSNNQDIAVQVENTKRAAESGAKIIVWNEVALLLNQAQSNTIVAELRKIASSYDAYILMAFFEECSSTGTKPINNKSIFIDKNGDIAWEYLKSRPTPVELPLVNKGNSVVPFFDTEYGRIGSVICYDFDFPFLLQQTGKNEVDIMLVPSYDWKGFAATHAKMARFESLQSGRSLIRSNGNGINTIVDSYGEVIASSNTFTGKEQILYANLPIDNVRTLYAKTGNIFVAICIVGFLLFVVARAWAWVKHGLLNRK